MKKSSKALLALAGVSLVIGAVSKFLIMESSPYLWLPFVVALLFIFIVVAVERKLVLEFMTLKTTKHGMNMGVMILLALILLVAVNFIAYKNNKKWDLTEEKLNSLSEQAVKISKELKEPLEIRGFYRKNMPEEEQAAVMSRDLIRLFQDESAQIKFEVIDPNVRPDLQKNFEADPGSLVFSYKGKRTAISDLTEEAVVNAIVKVTRERNKVVYYLTGHGELDLDSNDPNGGANFKKALQDSSYDLLKLSLMETPAVPSGADMVMILGPKGQLFDAEIKALEQYAKDGGNIFLTVDPGVKHNLSGLLRRFGVNFKNNYIIDQASQLVGQSPAIAIGSVYSDTSEITAKLPKNMISLFYLTSVLEIDPSAPSDFRFDEIVKSSPASFAKNELKDRVQFNRGVDPQGPLTIAITVTGTMGSQVSKATEEESSKKQFQVVTFGDTEFLSNQFIDSQANRNLILNTVAWLAKDEELISIKPKTPSGNQLVMTQTQAQVLVWGVYLPIPLLLFTIAGIVWFRRRGA